MSTRNEKDSKLFLQYSLISQGALNHLVLNFTTYLQSLMCGAGFDENEREGQCLLACMHLCLLQVANKLHTLNCKAYEDTAAEEKASQIQQLLQNAPLANDPKVKTTLNLFSVGYHESLRSIMLRYGFDARECEETNLVYVNFFSMAFVALSELHSRSCVDFHSRSQLGGMRKILDSKYSLWNALHTQSSFVDLEEILNDDTRLLFVKRTRKYDIFCISQNSMKIAMKVLSQMISSFDDEIEKLNNELRIGRAFSHPAFRKSYKKTSYQGREALLLEWAEGMSLDGVDKLTIDEFLPLAREITSALLQMHQKGMIHTKLYSEHIIFDEETQSIKLIGCSSCTSLQHTIGHFSVQNLDEKALHFVSPEQTGRTSKDIDFRSDFYSLGIVFYKLLAGFFPLTSDDSFKLIHMHLLEEPTPLYLLEAKIPLVISDMVSKLMEKDVDRRYQSAKGIMHDLELLITENKTNQQLNSVILAQHDTSENFHIPQKKYGHYSQRNIICSAFDRLNSDSLEIVFVSGDSGTGKSSLVFDLYKPVAQREGIFIRGKYDSNKNEPFAGLIQAITNFCDDLQMKDRVTIANFKSKIIDAIGEESLLLTKVITSLNFLIGYQPVVPDAFGIEATNRFYYVFIRFFKAICSVGPPLVLVLEDLQYIDENSADVLLNLLNDTSISNLMLVGTYRGNDIDKDHVLNPLIKRAAELRSTLIKLDTFDENIVNDIVSDTLCISPLDAYPLSSRIYDKTKGNFFLVKQMLQSLYEDGSIFYSNEKNAWWFKLKVVAEYHDMENVADVLKFLRLKLKSYSNCVQQALISASCLGSPFPLRFLKIIVNSNTGIAGAISSGMISQHKGRPDLYSFVHDKIQQASFSLVPEENRSKIFFHLGYKLWKNCTEEEINQNIYVIGNLFQRAVSEIEKEDDKQKIANLFLQAGSKLMSSTAYKEAFKYLETGKNLLGKKGWKTSYSLTLKLCDEAAKASYCVRKFSLMNELTDEISLHAQSPLDLVRSFSLQIKLCSDQRQYDDAIKFASIILNKIGEKIDLSRFKSSLNTEAEKAKKLFSSKSKTHILALNRVKDERNLSISLILNDILISSFYSNPLLCTYCSLRLVLLAFEHGISKYSILGFSGFASFLCTKGDKLAYHVGELSLLLLRKTRAKEFSPLTYFAFYGLITPFFDSIHNSLEPLLKSFSTCLEIGSQESAFVIANTYCRHAFLSGAALEKIQKDIEEFQHIPFIKTISYRAIHQAVLNLQNECVEQPFVLKGEIFNVSCCFDKTENSYDITRSLVICLVVAYIFNNFSLAKEYARAIRPMSRALARAYQFSIFLFYECLVNISIARESGRCNENREEIEENLKLLKEMAVNAPSNYLNKVLLIEAELAAIDGEIARSEEIYRDAILKANGFMQEKAISYERLGDLYLSCNEIEKASRALSHSFHYYEVWGAKVKSSQLRKSFPLLLLNRYPIDPENSLRELQLDEFSQAAVSALSNPSFDGFSIQSYARKRIRFSN